MEKKIKEIIIKFFKEKNIEVKIINYLNSDERLSEVFIINKENINKYFQRVVNTNELITSIIINLKEEDKYELLKEMLNNKIEYNFKDAFDYYKDRFDFTKLIIDKRYKVGEMLKYIIENDMDLINYMNTNKDNDEVNIYLINLYKEICENQSSRKILIYILNKYENNLSLFIEKYPEIESLSKKESSVIEYGEIISKRSEFKLDENVISNNYFKYNLAPIFYYKLIKEISKEYSKIINEDIDVIRESNFKLYIIRITDKNYNLDINKISKNYDSIIDKYIKITKVDTDDVFSIINKPLTSKNEINSELIKTIIYDIEINENINKESIYINEEAKLEYVYKFNINREKINIKDEFEYSCKLIKILESIENEYNIKIENLNNSITIRGEKIDINKIKWVMTEMFKIRLEDYNQNIYKHLNLEYEIKNEAKEENKEKINKIKVLKI